MLFYLYRGHIAAAVAGVLALLALLVYLNTDEPASSPVAWVLVDLSGSTQQARPRYSEEFRTLATNQSMLKGGQIALLPIKGDPAGESEVRRRTVGVTTNNPSSADIDRRRNVLQAANELDSLLRNPPQRVGGSAIVEGLWLLANKVHPGETVTVFSDALQNSQLLSLAKRRKELSSQPQIERILDELQDRGYIADMQGLNVRFLLPSFTAGKESITDPTRIKAFWQAWATRVHATLDYG